MADSVIRVYYTTSDGNAVETTQFHVDSNSYYNGRGQIVIKNYTKIDDGAFSGNTTLTEIELQGVTEIGDNAFAGCEVLEKVTMYSGLTKIGDNAFLNTPELDELIFPDTAVDFGSGIISGCGVNHIVMTGSQGMDLTDDDTPDTYGLFEYPEEYSANYNLMLMSDRLENWNKETMTARQRVRKISAMNEWWYYKDPIYLTGDTNNFSLSYICNKMKKVQRVAISNYTDRIKYVGSSVVENEKADLMFVAPAFYGEDFTVTFTLTFKNSEDGLNYIRRIDITFIGIKNAVIDEATGEDLKPRGYDETSSLDFNSYVINIYSDGQTVKDSFSFSNIENFSVKSSASWLSGSITKNEDLGTGVLNITATQNDTNTQRNGTLTVTGELLGDTIVRTITVQQGVSYLYGYIKTTTNQFQIDPRGGGVTGILQTNYVDSISYKCDASWLDIQLNGLSFSLNADANTGEEERSTTVRFYGVSSTNPSKVINYIIRVTQDTALIIEEVPAYQDIDVIINTMIYSNFYTISVDDDIVFSGRYYPTGDTATVRINDIIENYLYSVIDLDTLDEFQDSKGYITVKVNMHSTNSSDSYTNIRYYKVYNDFSYDGTMKDSREASQPILDFLDSRQLFVYSVFGHNENDFHTTELEAEGYDENDDDVFYHSGKTTDGYLSFVHDIGEEKKISTYLYYSDDDGKYLVGNRDFDVKCTNYRYALYYLNAYGGYDSFLFNRTSKQSDSITNYSYDRNYSNTTKEFGTKQYEKGIDRKWSLKSPLLSDYQASLFHKHLLTSTQCYLHDLEANVIDPVVINTTTAEKKTYYNNSRKPIQYTIEVEGSQSRIRR